MSEANNDIFCKIIRKEVSSDFISEGNNWIAIRDIHPVAPVHALIIPKKHGSIRDYGEKSAGIMGELLLATNQVAEKLGVARTGYRLIINFGEDSQADVMDHMHIHLLGGKKLGSKLLKEN